MGSRHIAGVGGSVSSFTVDLLTGLSAYLAAHSITTPVFFKVLPTSPDRCIAITAYSSVDEPKIALSHVRVQFWFRSVVNDSLDVDDLADSVFALLQGAENVTFGTAHMVQALRVSSIQLGIDSNKRAERSDNYEFDLDVPTTSGRPW